jgi:hypothetical protein
MYLVLSLPINIQNNKTFPIAIIFYNFKQTRLFALTLNFGMIDQNILIQEHMSPYNVGCVTFMLN